MKNITGGQLCKLKTFVNDFWELLSVLPWVFPALMAGKERCPPAQA